MNLNTEEGFIEAGQSDHRLMVKRADELITRLVREPDMDDTVNFCPECEQPNQFGDLCESCRAALAREDRIDREMDYGD